MLITTKLKTRNSGRNIAIHTVESRILYTCDGTVYLYPFFSDNHRLITNAIILAIKKALAAPIKPKGGIKVTNNDRFNINEKTLIFGRYLVFKENCKPWSI